ncbi:MAG: redoxin domain-containing protein [Bacteroidota bacterium]
MITYLLNFLISAVLLTSAQPQSTAAGFKIKVKVKGLADSACYLGNYYGQHQYIKDTVKANAAGELVFEGTEDLPGGIYFVVLPKKKFFEFIVNKEQVFSLETDTSDFVRNMKVKGSPENQLFYDYLRFISDKQKQYEGLKGHLDKLKDNKDSTAVIRKQMDDIDKSVRDYKTNLITNHPETFMSRFMLASKDPDVPDAPILSNGRKDSTFTYYYYRNHYWDNIDFSDDRILRTPVFYNRIKQYFDNVIPQMPDSIIFESDRIIEKARANKEMFKYVIWYLTYTYETSDVMGYDAIFVHLVEKYYMTNQAYWISAKVLENITKRAMKLKPILIGQPAPNMIMQDTTLQLRSMYSLTSHYTILLFWDWSCGHCKAEMPKVKEFYEQKKDSMNFEIFGVCTDTNLMEMKKFLRTYQMHWINVNGPRTITGNASEAYDIYSTPVIYLLDDKKVILAKRLSIEQVADFIRRDMKRRKTLKQ